MNYQHGSSNPPCESPPRSRTTSSPWDCWQIPVSSDQTDPAYPTRTCCGNPSNCRRVQLRKPGFGTGAAIHSIRIEVLQFKRIGTATLLIFGAGFLWWLYRKPQQTHIASERFELPENATPFNILSLLKDIECNNGLTPEGKQDLAISINRIERYYFAEVTHR